MIVVISPKAVYAAKRLINEAKILKCLLVIMDLKALVACNFKPHMNSGDVLYVRNPYFGSKPDYLPEVIELAKIFGAVGGRVVDANIAKGDLGLGKWRDYQKLEKAGLPISQAEKFEFPALPADRRNPKFEKKSKFKISNLKPYIVKWIYGLKGKGTFLVKSEKDFKKIPVSIPKAELISQEFIRADYEYKIITIGYKALPVILRFGIKPSGFRIDFASHKAIKAELVPQIVSIAEKASKTLGRELAKVDILEKGGKFYILEVNRFPGLKSFEQLTKYNVYWDFVEYLQKPANLV